jgi:coenzyme F420-reducing hydrogenase beta subunit
MCSSALRRLQPNDFVPLTDVITVCCKDAADFPSARDFVATLVRAWFEQSLVETVIGVRAMRNRKEWSDRDIEKALSPEALTAAAMQKYHVVTCTHDDLVRRLPGLPRVGLFQSA